MSGRSNLNSYLRLSILLLVLSTVISCTYGASVSRKGSRYRHRDEDFETSNNVGADNNDHRKHLHSLRLRSPKAIAKVRQKLSDLYQNADEDWDKSNERNMWFSHPKPKTKYRGPDTFEVNGLGIPGI